jgi:hypothetical protein
MALSDTPKFQNTKSKRPRAIGDKSRHWSDSQKIEAVTTYLALGEIRLTANVLKIPEVTVRLWKQKDWWKEIEAELRTQENLQLSTRLKRIVTKSIEAVEDRLEHGDYIYDQKIGQLIRKPVSLQAAHKVTMDMIDKREALLDRQPQAVSLEQIDDKLKKLAEKFAEIARPATQINVTDVLIGTETVAEPLEDDDSIEEEDDIDAVHEEREEGLQEGK